jgi:hypothetical protein
VELRIPLFATLALMNSWVFNAKYPAWVHLMASLAAGSWFGGIVRISRVVELLEHYDRSKAYLEKRIADLTSKRGVTDLP